MSSGVFISNFGFAILIVLLLLALFYVLNQFQKKALALLSRLSATYNEIETLLVRMTNSLDAINAKLAEMERKQEDVHKTIGGQSRQISEIADGFSETGQMSKAIDLARSGASIQDIMIATKLPEEEAEAIVKFHGGRA